VKIRNEEAAVAPNDVIGRRGDAGGTNITQLSPSDVTRLRAQLLRELREQTELVAQQVHDLEDLPAGAAGALEVERDVAEDLLTLRRQAIEGITLALARIDNGTYGTCQGCHGAIPVERLEVIPHARLCVTCRAVSW
jgi:DnaK suppressor protein